MLKGFSIRVCKTHCDIRTESLRCQQAQCTVQDGVRFTTSYFMLRRRMMQIQGARCRRIMSWRHEFVTHFHDLTLVNRSSVLWLHEYVMCLSHTHPLLPRAEYRWSPVYNVVTSWIRDLQVVLTADIVIRCLCAKVALNTYFSSTLRSYYRWRLETGRPTHGHHSILAT